MAAATTRKKRGSAWLLGGILPINRAAVTPDVIAGGTLAALAIPEVMGYANIAGTPVVTGLYTLLLPVLFFAILGSSRHLVVGADSASAAILAAGLVAMGAVAESTEYVELASLAALMCGVFLLLARLLRLGFIANFLSRSVLIGFLTGVGIQVAMGQVAGMFGVPATSGGTVQKFVEALQEIPTQTNAATLLVSVAVLGTILILGRVNKKIPGALLAVIGAIVVSYVVDLASYGVTMVGAVPGGLPALSLPTEVMTSENIVALLPTAIAIVVVILAQSAATSNAYAMKYGDSFNENADLVGLSMANIGAGITGTFVVNGSPTKTEMVDSAGGRSQISQLTAGVIVGIVLLFLTGLFAYMPNAVLAAVVFLIGLRLIDYKGMAEIARLRMGEFVVALITAAIVVTVGVEQGVILAIFLSILEHIYHSYKPYDTLVKATPTGQPTYVPLAEGTEAAPGLVIYHFGANLYYANGSRFTEEIVDLVETADPPLRWLALSGSAIGDVDFSGADRLRQVKEELARLKITFAMSDVSPNVRKQLDAYGLTEKIGADRIYPTAADVVVAFRAEAGTEPPAVPQASTEPSTPDPDTGAEPPPARPDAGTAPGQS